MKNQALFSSNDKSKKIKCRLLQFLFGAIRVNARNISVCHINHSRYWMRHLMLVKGK